MKLPRFRYLGLGVFVVFAGAFLASVPAHAGATLNYAVRTASINASAFNGDPTAEPPPFSPIIKSHLGTGSFSGAMMDAVDADPYPVYADPSSAKSQLDYQSAVNAHHVAVDLLATVSALAGEPYGSATATASYALNASWEITQATAYHLSFDATSGYADLFQGLGGLNLSLNSASGPFDLSGILQPGTYYLSLGFLVTAPLDLAPETYSFALTFEDIDGEPPTKVPDHTSPLLAVALGVTALAGAKRLRHA